MIQMQSYLDAADNSGAKELMCIKVLGGSKRRYAHIGDIIKRHTKPNPQAGQPGGVIEREAPIHISNVMLFNPASGKGERVGVKVLEDGRKLRVFRSSGEAVDA